MKTSPKCSSPAPFDALAGGRVADRVNGKSGAFDRAGGLSGRLSRYATNFCAFGVSMTEDTKPEKYRLVGELCSTVPLKHVLHSGDDKSVDAADTSVRATSGATAHWRKWQSRASLLAPRIHTASQIQISHVGR